MRWAPHVFALGPQFAKSAAGGGDDDDDDDDNDEGLQTDRTSQ